MRSKYRAERERAEWTWTDKRTDRDKLFLGSYRCQKETTLIFSGLYLVLRNLLMKWRLRPTAPVPDACSGELCSILHAVSADGLPASDVCSNAGGMHCTLCRVQWMLHKSRHRAHCSGCCMPAASTAGCSFQGSILLMGQTTETESGASVAESEEVTGTRKSGETNSLWKLRSL